MGLRERYPQQLSRLIPLLQSFSKLEMIFKAADNNATESAN
jgi:hypothetical protein